MADAVEMALKLEEKFGPKPEPVAVVPLQTQLFPWGENVRGMAKTLARSALFAVRDKRVPRVIYDNEIIASLQNVDIRFWGEELRQDDHDVFMQLCHLARNEDLGVEVRTTGLDALRGLGWGSSLEDYKRLRECYYRLLRGTIVVTPSGCEEPIYGSHLLGSIASDSKSDSGVTAMASRWTIKLDLQLAAILTGDEMTLIDWVRHHKLSALAKWLHRFYSTHETPIAYKADTLHALCGSRQANMPAFRQKLKKAFEELIATGYKIDSGTYLVKVRRSTSVLRA
jgi:hypothetical protein